MLEIVVPWATEGILLLTQLPFGILKVGGRNEPWGVTVESIGGGRSGGDRWLWVVPLVVLLGGADWNTSTVAADGCRLLQSPTASSHTGLYSCCEGGRYVAPASGEWRI